MEEDGNTAQEPAFDGPTSAKIFRRKFNQNFVVKDVSTHETMKAIDVLSSASFKKKEAILKAIGGVITFDKKLNIEETEFQMSLYAAFGCPHPHSL